ncbi:MAG: hypothetical protein Q8L80_01105, partial [Gallionella sp.]|nr:hypothetical protein [Gallionella sp.]
MIEEAVDIGEEISQATAPEFRHFPSARFYASVIFMFLKFFAFVVAISFVTSSISWLPDVDFSMEPLLHHRSIITHSILIPGILCLTLRRYVAAKFAIAIILAAISIHLFADTLSPPIGYGEIWFPPGGAYGLGILSPAFLLANACLCVVVAIKIFPVTLRSELSAAMLLSGLLYAIINEQSVASAAFIFLMIVAIFTLLFWRGDIPDTPNKLVIEFRSKRNAEVAANAAYVQAERVAWQSKSKLKRILIQANIFVISLYTLGRWILINPGKAGGSASVIIGVVLCLYIVGISGDKSTGNIFEAVGSGVWKLHSSGGY